MKDIMSNFTFKFQGIVDKTAKDSKGLLFYAHGKIQLNRKKVDRALN